MKKTQKNIEKKYLKIKLLLAALHSIMSKDIKEIK